MIGYVAREWTWQDVGKVLLGFFAVRGAKIVEFIPAGEIIGKAHKIRTIDLAQSKLVPDGEYKFVDMYCVDPECDCRKTMIAVYHNNEWISTIHYGWESPDFYREWIGDIMDGKLGLEMSGSSIASINSNIISSQEMLSFFNALLSEEWVLKFKEHYAAVKKKISKKKK